MSGLVRIARGAYVDPAHVVRVFWSDRLLAPAVELTTGKTEAAYDFRPQGPVDRWEPGARHAAVERAARWIADEDTRDVFA